MRKKTGIAAVVVVLSAAGVIAATTASAGASATRAADHDSAIVPGDLLVSESYYQNDPGIVAGTTRLSPASAGAAAPAAAAGGNYPYVFNNDSVDGSFGVTSQSAAGRRRPRRGRTDHHPVHPGRVRADARRPDPGWQLQRHGARRQGGQGRQGRQLPRPDDLQQRALLHQGKRQQRR